MTDVVKKHRQAVFNKAARQIIKQGGWSADVDGSCLYRGTDGSRCAIGACIPNSLYSKKLEGLGAADLPKRILAMLLPRDTKRATFLTELQFTHDGNVTCAGGGRVFLRRWKRQMRDLAAQYGLSAHALDKPK